MNDLIHFFAENRLFESLIESGAAFQMCAASFKKVFLQSSERPCSNKVTFLSDLVFATSQDLVHRQ